jgi:hypothetical protein
MIPLYDGAVRSYSASYDRSCVVALVSMKFDRRRQLSKFSKSMGLRCRIVRAEIMKAHRGIKWALGGMVRCAGIIVAQCCQQAGAFYDDTDYDRALRRTPVLRLCHFVEISMQRASSTLMIVLTIVKIAFYDAADRRNGFRMRPSS